MIFHCSHPSPIGRLLLVSDGAALTGLYMEAQRRGPAIADSWIPDEAPFTEVRRQLDAYFAGALTRFELPLAPSGTPFQENVWRALCDIPYGETRSYDALAQAVGAPGAARAVGSANARNPIGLIVPCHRVIARSGALTGYAAGLERKRWLLDHEAAHSAGTRQLSF